MSNPQPRSILRLIQSLGKGHELAPLHNKSSVPISFNAESKAEPNALYLAFDLDQLNRNTQWRQNHM